MKRLRERGKQRGGEKYQTVRGSLPLRHCCAPGTLLYDSIIIMNKTGRVFCAALKQFAPLRAKSIKAWNQRRGRDAAQRSHGSLGAPLDVTGQKTLHQGLPHPPLFLLILSPYLAITELFSLITFFALSSPPFHCFCSFFCCSHISFACICACSWIHFSFF